MAKKIIIEVFCFGEEIGRLGLDEDTGQVIFQYNGSFLDSGKYKNIFPPTGIIKRTKLAQKIRRYDNTTFKGLPPPIADSLPDEFGNIILKEWLAKKGIQQISVLEQLTYIANRGMGALEYRPIKKLPTLKAIKNIAEIREIALQVIKSKKDTQEKKFAVQALINIFRMGTSAGGARPKILISEHKKTKEVFPGDIEYSQNFNHYLVKFSDTDESTYPRGAIEYCYYLTASQLGIQMMPSKLIEQQYFATQRFDRQKGKKELFRRMVFNIVFYNLDDHLKNHSFIYDQTKDKWHLSPAYDLTYPFNPTEKIKIKAARRALSLNGKRIGILLEDILLIADSYTIKNPKGLIKQTQNAIKFWKETALNLCIPKQMMETILADFEMFDW